MKPKYAVLVIGFITSVITGVLLSPSSTHAASAYDNVVQTTNTLSVISPDGTQNVSLAENGDLPWYQLIESKNQAYADARCGDSYISSLNNARSSGYVSVVQAKASEHYQRVYVIWTDDTYPYAWPVWTFQTTESGTNYAELKSPTGGDLSIAQIEIADNGDWTWLCWSSGSPSFGVGSPDGYIYRNNYSVTYPDGYDGVYFANLTPISTPNDSSYKPDLNVISVVGYHAVIQDRNFNTFDPVPFTCNDTLTPIMHYELWKGSDPNTDVKLTDGVMSPTVPFEYDVPSGSQDTYTLVAWYSCAPGDLTFDQSSFLSFQVNEYGSLVQECGDDIQGFLCKASQNLSIGIFSTTFNGLLSILNNMKAINPVYCSTAWISQNHFQSNILPVQNFPPKVCQFAQNMYISNNTPFYSINLWLNIVLKGAAILLLVFGILSILGFKVRLPSPIGEENGTDIRPDIPTSSSISKHRGSYSRTPSGTRSTDATFTPGNSGKWHDRKPERWR